MYRVEHPRTSQKRLVISPDSALRRARCRAAGASPLLALAPLLLASACGGIETFPMTWVEPRSDYAHELWGLQQLLNWLGIGVGVVITGLLIYIIYAFRWHPGMGEPEQIHGNTRLELVWTLIPALLLAIIVVPTVRIIFQSQEDPPPDALTIDVIGHQWWWEFRYPEQAVTTANQFYVPVGRTIRLQMHSNDVIHSFWIPRFGGKRDVNPLNRVVDGVSHNLNFITFTPREAGIYHGQCAEFCGASHAIMLMTAVAVPEDEFAAWITSMQEPIEPPPPPPPAGVAPVDPDAEEPEAQPLPAPPPPRAVLQAAMPVPTGIGRRVEPPITADELAAAGEEVFMRTTCIACHAIAGTGARGVLGPNLTRYAARPTVGAGAARNTQENVEAWIRNPHSMKPGALMPGTRTGGGGMPATNLTDEEVRAVAAYLLSLR
jgi:cytochrome c oxidase subunit II